MYFNDRQDAGKQLADLLSKYNQAKDAIILGLPRGGVVVAYEVAKKLNIPLDIICPRKIGAPFNPEFAIGAVTESGHPILHHDIVKEIGIPQTYIDEAVAAETDIAKHRVQSYRKKMPQRVIKGKTVILIDDGLATGATMEAAIHSVREDQAQKVIVAVPVAPPSTLERIRPMADEVYCIIAPPMFSAIGQFYFDFNQTDDDQVIALLHANILGD